MSAGIKVVESNQCKYQLLLLLTKFLQKSNKNNC